MITDGKTDWRASVWPYFLLRKTTLDIPEPLHKKAKIRAIEQGQTLKQLVLTSLERERKTPQAVQEPPASRWDNRKLLPEYEAALQSGALSGGRDSSVILSEDRDRRADA